MIHLNPPCNGVMPKLSKVTMFVVDMGALLESPSRSSVYVHFILYFATYERSYLVLGNESHEIISCVLTNHAKVTCIKVYERLKAL